MEASFFMLYRKVWLIANQAWTNVFWNKELGYFCLIYSLRKSCESFIIKC